MDANGPSRSRGSLGAPGAAGGRGPPRPGPRGIKLQKYMTLKIILYDTNTVLMVDGLIPVRGPSETVRENTGQEGAPAPPRPALGFFQVFPGSGLFGFCLRVSPRVLALDFRWVFHLEFLCGFCFCFVWGVPCGVNLHFIR